MKNELEYSHLRKQMSTKTIINDTSNIRQLTLSSFKFENRISYHRFTNVQSLILTDINDNINYNQLNRIIDLLSIKHIEFNLKINLQLFCDILKYHPKYLSIEILYSRLQEIFETKIENLHYYFPNIQQLNLEVYLSNPPN